MRRGLAGEKPCGRCAAQGFSPATRGAASRFESCGGVQPLGAGYAFGCRWGGGETCFWKHFTGAGRGEACDKKPARVAGVAAQWP